MFPQTISPRVPPLVWQLLVVCLAFVPTGWASPAECASGWEWSENSKKQNPCEVAGYLQGACLGYDVYELEPLDGSDYWYTEPEKGDTDGLKCGCNTIIYSLYSACTACQNASTLAWPQWNKNCDAVYVTQYPFNIPGGTAVPQWAFIDITKTDFNATIAKEVGRDPETFGKVPVTLSLSSTFSSSTSGFSSIMPGSSSSVSDPLSTNGGSDSGGKSSDQNNELPAIIGGVIGGVVGFSILSSLIWFFLRRRSRGTPPRATNRSFSHRTLLTRQSYYPSSVSVHSSRLEMDEPGDQTPMIHSPLNVTPREPMYSPRDARSIISSAESDLETTRFFPLYGSERGHNERTEF